MTRLEPHNEAQAREQVDVALSLNRPASGSASSRN